MADCLSCCLSHSSPAPLRAGNERLLEPGTPGMLPPTKLGGRRPPLPGPQPSGRGVDGFSHQRSKRNTAFSYLSCRADMGFFFNILHILFPFATLGLVNNAHFYYTLAFSSWKRCLRFTGKGEKCNNLHKGRRDFPTFS